jgi:hypothetical protein
MSSTRAAPARFKTRAQASAVLPGGQDVVDKDDGLPGDRGLVRNIERPGDGLAPLQRTHAFQRRRATAAPQGERVARDFELPRELVRNQLRLIEAAVP